MAFSTYVKTWLNRGLNKVNLRLDSTTLERHEERRLRRLDQRGYFGEAAFPIPPSFRDINARAIYDQIQRYADRFADFHSASQNDTGYSFDNPYFSSPDAEVLYAMIQCTKPPTIVEVGSGNSTKVSRQAIIDGDLNTRLVSIDPCPRTQVSALVDELFAQPIEQMVDHPVIHGLQAGDILFIDSSHTFAAGNDCVAVYLRILPHLAPGILVHVHDVFLPYDYPRQWVIEERRTWHEQYVVHTMLMRQEAYEVIWAGHFLQRMDSEFEAIFPYCSGQLASSLWLQIAGA